jgi:hypothetical protein
MSKASNSPSKLGKANQFESALDEGRVYTDDNAWWVRNGAVEHLTTYGPEVDGAAFKLSRIRECNALFTL